MRIIRAFQILSLFSASFLSESAVKKRVRGKTPPNTSGTRKELIGTVLKYYDKQAPPEESEGTIDRVGMYVNAFHSIDSVGMEYSMTLYFRQSWRDKRLQFNESQYKFEQLLVGGRRRNDFWVPDTFVRNEKKAIVHQVTVPNVLMRINSTGHVWYVQKLSATYYCPMQLQKFPFETQMCQFMIESFAYTKDVLDLKWLDSPVDVDPGIQLPQFTLQDIILLDCSQNYTSGSYPCLEVRFVLRRDSGYYIGTFYFPSFLIVLLSCSSFWFGIQRTGARLGLGLFTILMLVMMAGTARSQLPKISYITAIDVWFIINMLFVFASMIELVVVTVMANRQGEIQSHEKGDRQAQMFASKLDKVCAGIFPIVFILFVILYAVICSV